MSNLVRPTGIRKALYKKLQHYCIEHELTPRDVLEKAIEEYLDKNSGSSTE